MSTDYIPYCARRHRAATPPEPTTVATYREVEQELPMCVRVARMSTAWRGPLGCTRLWGTCPEKPGPVEIQDELETALLARGLKLVLDSHIQVLIEEAAK